VGSVVGWPDLPPMLLSFPSALTEHVVISKPMESARTTKTDLGSAARRAISLGGWAGKSTSSEVPISATGCRKGSGIRSTSG